MIKGKAMKRISMLVLCLVVACSVVSARPVTVTLTMPTLNDDDTTLTDLAGGTIHWGNIQGGPYPFSFDFSSTTPGEEIEEITPDLIDGTWYFIATAFNDAGNRSIPSDEVSTIVFDRAPAAPVIERVTP